MRNRKQIDKDVMENLEKIDPRDNKHISEYAENFLIENAKLKNGELSKIGRIINKFKRK